MITKTKKTIFLIRIVSVYFLTLFGNEAHSAPDKSLPPIIDYYPNCNYQVIKEHLVKNKTEQPRSQKEKDKLLLKLRKKALEVGATAVIIEKRNISTKDSRVKVHGSQSTAPNISILSYQALLIKTCQDSSGLQTKASPYNHEGTRVIDTINTTIQLSTKISFTPPEKEKLYRPKILQKNISLENGIYGLKLGSDYSQTVELFGDPSIEFSLLEGEKIIGYGRDHWLHFQAGKLIKVSNESTFLSQDTLNKIPLIGFFNDSHWQIKGLVSRKTSLADVQKKLNLTHGLNDENQLIIKNNTDTMILNFDYNKNSQTNKVTYSLSGFSLFKSTYKEPANVNVPQVDKQFDTLSLAVLELNNNDSMHWPDLSQKLGEPMGRITLTAQSYINIYNTHLAIAIKNTELRTIYLLEEVFKIEPNKVPWYLGKFSQGKTIAQLNEYFSKDAVIYENEVKTYTDNYQLLMFFDDDLGLYEAVLKVY